jgi:hypothetical protein
VVPFITERITRFFSLRNEISLQIDRPSCSLLTRQLGIPAFERALGDLERLYQTSQWFVQEEILHFLRVVCFAEMFV